MKSSSYYRERGNDKYRNVCFVNKGFGLTEYQTMCRSQTMINMICSAEHKQVLRLWSAEDYL